MDFEVKNKVSTKKEGGLEEMIERNLVLPDMHVPNENKTAVTVARKINKYYKPHRIIVIGNFFDMTPVSHWMKDKKKSMENQRLAKDYAKGNRLLNKFVREAGSQLSEVVYLKGNHEKWADDYVDKNPEMEGLVEVEHNIKIDKKKVDLKFVEMNDFYKVGKLYLTHGLHANKYHAFTTVDRVGASVMYGHTHDVQTYTKIGLAKSTDKHMGLSVGCLCDLSPAYMKNRPNNWMHAVAMVDVFENGDFVPHVLNIVNGKTVYANKIFRG